MPSPLVGNGNAKEADGLFVKTLLQTAESQANKQRVDESTKMEEGVPICHAEPVTVATSVEQALSRPLYALTAK
jgi:hypothetical protein